VTLRRETVRALRDVRLKLRDLALADHAAVSDVQMSTEEILAAAREGLDGVLATATEALQAASTVNDLDRVSRGVAAHHLLVEDAHAEYVAAVAVTSAAAERLRDREREARRADLVVDRCDQEISRFERRQEQRSHDDRRRPARDTSRPR
jgi:hypothetical protein